MKIKDMPLTIADFEAVAAERTRGERGFAGSRAIERNDIRVRMVEYSPGYLADHWCTRGHVALVVKGELFLEIDDGRSFELKAGMGFLVADGRDAHRVYSENGARVFIVD